MSGSLARRAPPDLGTVKTVRDDRVPGGWLTNIAGVVEMARTGGTPKAAAFYAAFLIAYERVSNLPMTDGAKQKAAFEEAVEVAGLPPIENLDPLPPA